MSEKKKCPRCGRLADEIRDVPDHDLPMCETCRYQVEERDYGMFGSEPDFPEEGF